MIQGEKIGGYFTFGMKWKWPYCSVDFELPRTEIHPLVEFFVSQQALLKTVEGYVVFSPLFLSISDKHV